MKPWNDRELWEKCFLSQDRVYVDAGKIIGYQGCGGFAFYDAAKKLPGYSQYRYENAVRDLCVFEKREKGEYLLTAKAMKVLRCILGPAPTDPLYASWWSARLVSVKLMRSQGLTVSHAEEPPVPLEPKEEPAKEPESAPKSKKRTKKK